MTPGDDPLVRRVRLGDAEALAEFLRIHSARLLAFIDRRIGAELRRKVEPADVLQEAGLSALKALPKTDLAGRDPFNWLCQLAEQRIIDAHRTYVSSQKRAAGREVPMHGPAAGHSSQGGLLDLLVASITSPSAALSRDQREVRLLAALEELPAEGREALRLRYAEGLASKEIAQRLGKTDGAVRVLLVRCLARLQQLLGSDAPS
jgi:RNA polymerase sigma-70 factor (ECF subfamily)